MEISDSAKVEVTRIANGFLVEGGRDLEYSFVKGPSTFYATIEEVEGALVDCLRDAMLLGVEFERSGLESADQTLVTKGDTGGRADVGL